MTSEIRHTILSLSLQIIALRGIKGTRKVKKNRSLASMVQEVQVPVQYIVDDLSALLIMTERQKAKGKENSSRNERKGKGKGPTHL